MNPRRAALVFALGSVAAGITVAWIDYPLTLAIARLLPPGRKVPMDIPDLLIQFVAAVTVTAFVIWLWTRGRDSFPRLSRVAPLIAVATPLALGISLFCKRFFGRMQAHWFIEHPASYGFHWLHGVGLHRGFPSGHMLVATVLVVLVIAVFPRLRPLGWLVLAALALAMLLTSYHFLGDIIAGWLIGATLAWVMLAADARLRPAETPRRRS